MASLGWLCPPVPVGQPVSLRLWSWLRAPGSTRRLPPEESRQRGTSLASSDSLLILIQLPRTSASASGEQRCYLQCAPALDASAVERLAIAPADLNPRF